MAAYEKQYPPYSGNDPYLFLCFSSGSGKKARALLSCLFARGVRVWYAPGRSGTRAEREASDSRMLSASLTVILLDEAFRSDPSAKSMLLACQRAGHPIVCLNTDGGDSGLSIGLVKGADEIRFSRSASAEEYESGLIRSRCFSRELIGTPIRGKNAFFRTAVIVTLTLAALLLAAGIVRLVFGVRKERPVPIEPQDHSGLQGTAQPEATDEPGDTVPFSDETVREAVRSSLGGGLLTEERLREVVSLRLEEDTLPADLSDLALLPSLETILLNQSAAKEVPSRNELSPYTIELYGGETP